MRTISSIADITAREYFTILDYIDKRNKEEMSDTEVISKLTTMFGLGTLTYKEADEQVAKLFRILSKDIDQDYDRIIKIDDEVFALEPNFEAMESGAYQDLLVFGENGDIDSMLSMLAILYRPIKTQLGGKFYSIESYAHEDQALFDYRVNLFGERFKASGIRGLLNFFTSSLKE